MTDGEWVPDVTGCYGPPECEECKSLRADDARWRAELEAGIELHERSLQIIEESLNRPPEYWLDKHDNGQWRAAHIAFAIDALVAEVERLRDLTRIRDARKGELPARGSKILIWEDDQWAEHHAGWYYCDGVPDRGAVQMYPHWLPAPEPPEDGQ